ncbi:transcriptional adapter 2-alpha [Anaeramoeba ignava]|uniref:Transcriptional adapter 2-alpha n=1 Tax=Anaeramoeba ignava TaxID=1746090 RepID=A0A9Q0LDW2_ANAIG|nr:transcriptional adapter 2-alpha [Anaeramoeba ignava]|eukprot:Anaeramoba_ignava/a217827_139.p1 GENE.a217827_139~~a217827_139.p1  ORF type:complete len:443 (-),score=110.08 a217827_139:24-1352(-)
MSRKTTIPEEFGTILCKFCNANITNMIRIICGECENTTICTDCLKEGKEGSGHKSGHKYRIIRPTQTHIFSTEWTMDEEILLLEATEKYGICNWEDISIYVGKTTKQCEDHYTEVYLNSTAFPLPDFEQQKLDEIAKYKIPAKKKKRSKTSDIENEDMLIPDLYRSGPREGQRLTNFAIHTDFMPLRKEFEFEYDFDAEEIIAEMGLHDNKIPWSIKMGVLQVYMDRVYNRETRKNFVISRDFLEKKNNEERIPGGKFNWELKKNEPQIYTELRVFNRLFDSQEQYVEFFNSVIEEIRNKKKIQQYQEWRRNGITLESDGKFFETEHKKRDSRKKPERISRRNRKKKWPKESFSLRTDPDSPMDLSSVSVELLSKPEQEICSISRILPQQYFAVKNLLITEYLASPNLFSMDKAVSLIHGIKKPHAELLIGFFAQNNWVVIK